MSKAILIVVGIILAILGVLALFPAIMTAPLWLAIVLLVVGVASVILGLIDRKKTA